jgi:ABC-2 type transport system ATP-binding protein
MLQVRRLEKTIEHRTALSIEQLDVAAGEVLGVIGTVGSGKTLLIRLLSGIVVPSGGSVVFDGQDVHRTPALHARMGLLFEEDLLYERLSAQNNLETYCQLHGLPGNRAREMLAQVGLSDQTKTSVNKLQPAAQRRLAFARALLANPALLLLDQPILRADLDTQMLFARLITQAASAGAVVVLTEEDHSWAGKCCTRVIELEAGQGSAAPERLIPYKVPARKDDRIVLYDPADLLYATSRDGKTILRTANDEATTNLTLQELETRLAGRGFFKAHRAYLVNLQHIKSVIQYTRNSYTLQLDDKQETLVPLSKQSEKELQELLGY